MNLKHVLRLTLVATVLILPLYNAHATQNDTPVFNRYFVKSEKSIWKKTFNARNVFKGGFTADLTPIQLNIAKFVGIDVSPVPVFHISPLFPKLTLDNLTAELTRSDSGLASSSKREVPSVRTGWNIALMRPNFNHDDPGQGENVSVAVLDTGYSTHPDLDRRIIECKDFSSLAGSGIANSCSDRNGHGTAVSSLVAADGGEDGNGMIGVAPATSLLEYKVCSDDGYCLADDIAAAIRDAVSKKTQVVNMSFGSNTPSDLIESAINEGFSHGTVFVAASGNDGPGLKSIDYPAAYTNVISVGAVTEELKIPNWSSRGGDEAKEPHVLFVAPGNKILAATQNGGYSITSGTSMAAAHISGLISLILSRDDSLAPTKVLPILIDSSLDLDKKGFDESSGYGLPRLR